MTASCSGWACDISSGWFFYTNHIHRKEQGIPWSDYVIVMDMMKMHFYRRGWGSLFSFLCERRNFVFLFLFSISLFQRKTDQADQQCLFPFSFLYLKMTPVSILTEKTIGIFQASKAHSERLISHFSKVKNGEENNELRYFSIAAARHSGPPDNKNRKSTSKHLMERQRFFLWKASFFSGKDLVENFSSVLSLMEFHWIYHSCFPLFQL